MRIKELPSSVETYKEGTVRTRTDKYKSPMIYKVCRGQRILVLFWYRWPSYDFIFGVPAADNPYRKQEAAFFQYRDVRQRKAKAGFYIDKRELAVLARGFVLLLKQSRRKPNQVIVHDKTGKVTKRIAV